MTVAKVQRRDDSWFILASRELGIQEPVLRGYAAHGDSLSLAVLIHITRQQFSHFWEGPWPEEEFSEILEAASKFNVEDTSHDLQHEFCALWNQIVLKVQNDYSWRTARFILRPIRNVYIALHQVTDSVPVDGPLSYPFSYPVCNVASHHPDSSPHRPHTHNVSTSASAARVAVLVPAPVANSEASSLSVPAPPHVDESLADVPPIDDFYPQIADEMTTERLFIPSTSPDSVTVDAFVTSGRIIPRPISATSTSAPPLSSTPPSTAVPPAPSDPPNLPPSSNPVLDNIFPTGAPLSSHPPMTRSEHSPSCPESHHSSTITTAPRNPPRPTSAPDLDAAPEDNGSPKPGSHQENDALDPPSVNHAIHANTTALDLLPQSSSLSLVAH
ncbi:hypothetical protein EDB92DRAFT_706372 [Lactarius akahatsu]|uniref:Uncharacterized protein n=1 Tax=Lactarius akahatsu TaxID=416441 RepID=A0AAD4LGM0_9AGAM|nr:hypothetical protein EDB92DRAFT_706372 [Lactarius akahatsu]